MQKLNLKNGDVISGAVLAALGTYIVIQSTLWPYYEVNGPGPGFFPIWYGILMVALSLWLIITAVQKPQAAAEAETEASNSVGLGRALLVWGGFTVSLVLMVFLGFCISFTLFTIFIVSYVLGRPILPGLLTGAISSAVFYVLFSVILDVQLPTGYVGF